MKRSTKHFIQQLPKSFFNKTKKFFFTLLTGEKEREMKFRKRNDQNRHRMKEEDGGMFENVICLF